MKIAIIGAGFFGSTIALKLCEQHTVHLYEKENNILNGCLLYTSDAADE